MNLRKLALVGLLVAFAAGISSATVSVTAQLTDGTGSTIRAGYLHFELENCGNNYPLVAHPGPSQNPWTIARTAFDLKPNQPDGSILGQVMGNDEIWCGNVASTYYMVTVMKDATTPLAPVGGEPFLICSASASPMMSCSNAGSLLGTWNPALQQPTFQPVPPGLVQIYGNPIVTQVWTQPVGTEADFYGTFNFFGANVEGLVQHYPSVGLVTSLGDPTAPNQPNTGWGPSLQIAGQTGCVFDSNGVLSIANNCGGGGGGGSTTPGGSTTTLQFNDANTFNGAYSAQYTKTTGELDTTNLNKLRYVTPYYNFLFTDVSGSLGNLTAAGSNLTITLPCTASSPCLGIDTSANANAPYAVYIAGTGTPETAPVLGGTCTTYATTSCSIIVTTLNNHPNGYTIGSATGGIQEAINTVPNPGMHIVLLPGTSYDVHQTVYIKLNKGKMIGQGAVMRCFTRSRCVFVGDHAGAFGGLTSFDGLEFQSMIDVDGVQVSSVSANAGIYTVTTVGNHPFTNGIVTNLGAQCPNFLAIANTACTGLEWVSVFYSTPANTQEARVQVLTGSLCSPACNPNQFQYWISGNTTFASSSGYGWATVENAGIEDGAQDVSFADTRLKCCGGGRFNWGFVNGVDQKESNDHLSNEGSGDVIHCTSNFCGAIFMARGDQGAAPITTLSNGDLSNQCHGNGVRNVAGNTLTIVNTVIQGYSQYAAFYAGGLQGWSADHVYQEASFACFNPSYAGSVVSAAGYISNGGVLSLAGPEPVSNLMPQYPNWTGTVTWNHFTVTRVSGPSLLAGWAPGQFTVNGSNFQISSINAGAGTITLPVDLGVNGTPTAAYIFGTVGTQRNYYAVPKDVFGGSYGSMGFAGYAIVAGGETITVQWPQVLYSSNSLGVTWDLLLTTGTSAAPPYVGSANSLTTNSTGVSCATTGICSFTDTQAGPSVYTFHLPQFAQSLWFWPAAVAMGQGGHLFLDRCSSVGPFMMTTYLPTVFCSNMINNGGVASTYTPFFAVAVNGEVTNNVAAGNGALRTLGGPAGVAGGLKGVLNFISPGSTVLGSTDVITISDSNPFRTLATVGYRPTADLADVAIGLDQGALGLNVGQLATRSPVSISRYINSQFDNKSWLERLSASAEQFQVPVTAYKGMSVLGTGCGLGCGPYALSGTQVTDTFPGVSLSGIWTVTDGAFSVANNILAVVNLGGDGRALVAYTGASFANDQFSQVTFAAGVSNQVGPGVRLANGATTGYFSTCGFSSCTLVECVANVCSVLWTASVTNVIGDVFSLYASGTTIQFYKNGILMTSQTDSHVASGFPGVTALAAGCCSGVSNFFAGDLTWRSTTSMVQVPTKFSDLPTCAAAYDGTSRSINDGLAGSCGDGTCTTWGTTVTAGGGALHRKIYCDGTNWTLEGK